MHILLHTVQNMLSMLMGNLQTYWPKTLTARAGEEGGVMASVGRGGGLLGAAWFSVLGGGMATEEDKWKWALNVH